MRPPRRLAGRPATPPTAKLRAALALLLLLGLAAGCDTNTRGPAGPADPEDPDDEQPQPVLAFPGAEGFGAQATGGRGGRVIRVTTLAASGPGSLQEALDQDEPRIVVFAVSGVIEADPIRIRHGDLTIAGQTAPGAGITIRGRLYGSDGLSNVIVRHLRIRPAFAGEGGGSYDGVQLVETGRVIFDHVSAAFGVDEVMGIFTVWDATVQWSTLSMSATQGHPEGVHNYALLANRPRVSLHHNLFAHNGNRNPACGRGPAEVKNNVVYNFNRGFIHHNPPAGQFRIVGNYYRQGPDGSARPFVFDDVAGEGLAYYLADNYLDDPGDYLGIVDNPWTDAVYLEVYGGMGKGEEYRATADFDFAAGTPDYMPITTQSPADAYLQVLETAGAWPRDVVDLTAVEETEQRTGEWGARIPADLLAGLTPAAPPADGDADGMADAWESAHGLSAADPEDHATVMASGYTAIEEYINGLADALLP